MDLYKYLCLFGTPVGVTDLILIQNLYLFRYLYLYGLMFIQDSRRSYRTYTNLTDAEVLVGTTELVLIY